MRVQYEVTLEEIAASHAELFAVTPFGRRQPLVAGLLAGIAVGATILYLFRMNPVWFIGPAAIALGALGFVFGRRQFHRELRRRLKNVARETHGPGPVPITVAVEPDGLKVDQESATISFSWDGLRVIDDQPDLLRFWIRQPLGLVRVPARAFRSFADRGDFVRLAREFHAAVGRSAE